MMIARVIAMLAAACLAGCAGHRGVDPPVRAMTYNIRLDTDADGANAWPHRRAAVSGLLRFYAPDVFGAQEVRLHQLKALAADLEDYAFVGVGRDDGRDGGEFSPLVYRRDRFDLGAHGTFWLSPTPERPSTGWDAAFPRIVSWAHLEERATGQRILALNTHWDHVGVEARRASARLILDFIGMNVGRCEAIILLGDFNAVLEEDSLRTLVADGRLIDALAASATPPFGPPGTFNGFDIASSAPAAIDHIFVGAGDRVLRHGVITQHDEGRLPSDHYPVLADIEMARCGGPGS